MRYVCHKGLALNSDDPLPLVIVSTLFSVRWTDRYVKCYVHNFNFQTKGEARTDNTGLFEMTVGVLTTCHTSRSPDATPCYFFLWGYVKDQVYGPPLPASIPELKVRIRTATDTITADIYIQFGTNSIIVLMFVESQRVHI